MIQMFNFMSLVNCHSFIENLADSYCMRSDLLLTSKDFMFEVLMKYLFI